MSNFYAMLTILLWSAVFVFTKILLIKFNSSEVGFIRYFFASAALIIVVIIKKIPLPAVKDFPMFIIGGATGFVIYVYTFNNAAALMNSGTCSLIITTAPIITAFLASFVYKEKVSIAGWITILLQFSGIIIMTTWNKDISINQGIIWMLLASGSLSIYNIIQRYLSKKGYAAIQIAAYCIFSGTILLGFNAPEIIKKFSAFGLKELIAAIYLGVLAGALAYFSWSKAIELTEKTSNITNYMFFIPVTTSIIGYFVEGEILPMSSIAGGSIILISFVIYIIGNK
ncbi:MAG: protein of unknown function transrane [Lachnospiraceae bacterium]|jgi:drug/metabolite transporter (DMT)-like permease|nr:protein of unknown function transrane [Lachnospiraceae bacterium]